MPGKNRTGIPNKTMWRLDFMKNMLTKFYPALTADTFYIFLQGIFWTLVFLLVVFILTGCLFLLLRKSRKVAGVTLQAPHGSLFIAASAVSDLIYSLDESFPDLEIIRVKLIRDGKELAIQVKVFYTVSGQSMLNLAENFQNKAMDLLKSSFGIDNISRIDLIVPKSKF